VQVQQLELAAHPLMRAEERAAAALLTAFTRYKQREVGGVLHFYGGRLLGLEDALLETRNAALALQARRQMLLAVTYLKRAPSASYISCTSSRVT
jgi:hypothetical protein